MLDGIRIIERVAVRGATLKALDRQWLDFGSSVAAEKKMTLARPIILSAFLALPTTCWPQQ
jgi:hypothetical protein